MRRTSLTKLARENDKLRLEDLNKLFDSQLSQVGQIGGFIVGIVFGTVLTVAAGKALELLGIFDLFTQPLFQGIFILLAALGISIVISLVFDISNRLILKFKIELTEDYLEAKAIVAGRPHESSSA